MKNLTTYLLLLFFLAASCNNSSKKAELITSIKQGDIIFHESKSAQSKAIQIATNSKYSHMGILYKEGSQWYVFEAVQPVKLTPLSVWIERGKNNHVVVKRLADREQYLSDKSLQKMKAIGEKYLNRDYDIYFEWSDENIYCSELVWKIYFEALSIRIGELKSLKDFDLSNDHVQAKLKERYGDALPLNEPVISPSSMFHSDKLITVFSN